MKDPDIQAAFKKFPEGLASDVDSRLKPNLEVSCRCRQCLVHACDGVCCQSRLLSKMSHATPSLGVLPACASTRI